MKDKDETKGELINELAKLRQRVAELEKSKTQCQKELVVAAATKLAVDTVEAMGDGLVLSTIDGKIISLNPALEKMTGYKKNELIGKNVVALAQKLVKPEDLHKIMRAIETSLKGKVPPSIPFTLLSKNGREIPTTFTISFLKDTKGKPTISVGTVKDITELKRTEEALQTSEKKCRVLVENASEAIIVVQEGIVKFVNPKTLQLSGYSKRDIIGRPFTEFIHPDDREMARQRYFKRLKGEKLPRVYPVRFITKEDNTKWGEINATLINWEGKPATLNFLTDITERKKAEEALMRLSIAVKMSTDSIVISDLDTKIIDVNESTLKMYGTDDRRELIGKSSFDLIAAEDRERALVGAKETLEKGYLKGREYHIITKDGAEIPVEMSVALMKDIDGKPIGFVGISRDITERKRAERKLQGTLKKLRKALGVTIQAMALTVETRDAYTAGHQQRVTNLARAIAKEMYLSEHQIDGIRMAGTIHDIGKIGVPAEILNKPTRLADIEFNLIKIHPLVGYNILKQIEFPWPVAKIVLQHHERMNGSGYPHGLSGEDILLEARILGVADVVEAMSSHRPYRPALGIDKALEEISKNRGILYDPGVADACLKLFTEKGFRFSKIKVANSSTNG